MSSKTEHALKIEADFLSRAEANLQRAVNSDLLPGDVWKTSRADESDRVRTMMVDRGVYDRKMLRSLPKNQRVVLHGFERFLFLWKRRSSVAVATTVSPIDAYLSDGGDATAPVTLTQLTEHVQRVMVDSSVPHVIGVCSPTGFTEGARAARIDLPNVSVVLVEPREDGGWRTTPLADRPDPRLVKLFDLEGVSKKIDRVREAVEARSGELLTGGLSAELIADDLDLPEAFVSRALHLVAEEDPELRVSTKAGSALLFRGAPVSREEKSSMSMIDRIRQLLGGEGDETQKINMLSERRATLAQRRDRIYNDIAKLEKRESELLAQGRTAETNIVKKRLAAQLAQLRKDIARQNTTANMLNQQINIISTHVHNLTLIKQGESAKLPDTEELTQDAVRAEEMLETLKADADLVGSLETGLSDAVTSDEELAILKEFDAPSEPAREPAEGRTARADAAPAMDEATREAYDDFHDETDEKRRERTDPEAT